MVPGLRIQKQYQLLPWVKLNISKSGFSLSIGPKDAHITTGPRGTYVYLNVPGAGIYYRRKLDRLMDEVSNGKEKEAEKEQEQALDLGFVQRLTTPANELALLDALQALNAGQEEEAYRLAQGADTLADGAFLAGFIALKLGELEQSGRYLRRALEMKDRLGETFSKYELDFGAELAITGDIVAMIQPNENGVLLALSEAYQYLGMHELAIEFLLHLHRNDPEDVVVRLSLAELYEERYADGQQAQQQIVQLAEGVHNVSPVHAALMLHRARALRKLGLLEGARDTLTKAMRRKKDYPGDLLRALRYERALVYEAQGKEKQARKEFQKVYAEAPGYEDVAAKLGL